MHAGRFQPVIRSVYSLNVLLNTSKALDVRVATNQSCESERGDRQASQIHRHGHDLCQ
jgi:hypothetical protein